MGVALSRHRRRQKLYKHLAQVKKELNGLLLTNEHLRQHMANLLQSINAGLGKHTHAESDVKCYPTFVQDLPDGSERGKFLALDLGGTNFRVLLIELGDDHLFKMKSRIYVLPPEIMIGTGIQLCMLVKAIGLVLHLQLNDHIAACLSDFIHRHNISETQLPLGYTFSFPLIQSGLDSGILQRWTKGFNVSGVIGREVVQMLRDALRRRGDVNIEIFAILNDTTGTLMSCAWRYPNCKIGLIVGTGCNSCYVEKIENVEMYDGDRTKPFMIINTEMGAFGENGGIDFLMTEYDYVVDRKSINPGRQRHEKLISGMYLNEIIRLILIDLIGKKLLLDGIMPEKLPQKNSFTSRHMSDIEEDRGQSHVVCRRVLEHLGARTATDQDCEVVEYVCEIVALRSAYLASSAMATLLNKMDFKDVTVGIDGSVYRFHPYFHDHMVQKMSELVDKSIKFQLVLSHDGSGRGAAIVAAVAAKEANT